MNFTLNIYKELLEVHIEKKLLRLNRNSTLDLKLISSYKMKMNDILSFLLFIETQFLSI